MTLAQGRRCGSRARRPLSLTQCREEFSMKKAFLWGISTVAAVAMVSAVAIAAETKGPVTDDLGVVEIPKDAPIVIGGYWVISGPDTALGLDSQRGVEIAFDELE